MKLKELLYKKLKWKSVSIVSEHLFRMAKLGAKFKPNTPSAVTCEDIVVTIPPNQVIPHKHKIEQRQARVLVIHCFSNRVIYFTSFWFVNLFISLFY